MDWLTGLDLLRRELTKLFKTYDAEVREKVLVLSNLTDQAVILPYLTRAHPDYIRKVRRVLRPLRKVKSNRSIMLTLTSDPSRFTSLAEAYRSLKKNFHRLMTWLTYRYGSSLQYLAVPEFTKSGLPHLHVVVLGVSELVRQGDLSKEWSKLGQGSVVDVRRCGQGFRNSSVFHYVMKYVEKSWDLEGDDPRNLYHIASLWALNGRSFHVSHGLLDRLSKKARKGFVYLGSFSKNIVRQLFDAGLEFGLLVIDNFRLQAMLSMG